MKYRRLGILLLIILIVENEKQELSSVETLAHVVQGSAAENETSFRSSCLGDQLEYNAACFKLTFSCVLYIVATLRLARSADMFYPCQSIVMSVR